MGNMELGWGVSDSKTFDEWVRDIEERARKNMVWSRIGEWLYPLKSNDGWSQVVFHLCPESRGSTKAIPLEEPCECGKRVPDGVKMIILLESL